MKYKRWTDEDISIIKQLTEAGWSSADISKEFDWSEDSIKGLRSKYNIRSINNRAYTKEELIAFLQTAEYKTFEYFNKPGNGLPAGSTYLKYFGSWNAALEAAGLDPNKSTLNPYKLTKVYLIDFGEVYKIGITQQTLEQRFRASGYPSFEPILVIETSLKEAKEIEEQWLNAVKEYKYVPDNWPKEGRGGSECFRL